MDSVRGIKPPSDRPLKARKSKKKNDFSIPADKMTEEHLQVRTLLRAMR
jgi:hypothetical protein